MSERPNFTRTRNGKDVRVAHRRTPSEMTPLVRDNLAMQQQMYSAQPPQFMVPPGQYIYQMPPPGMVPMVPFYHQRTRSQGSGHARRHSLQVSEAIEAAKARTEQGDGSGAYVPPHVSSGVNAPANAPGGTSSGPEHTATPSFKFPPSPEKEPEPQQPQQQAHHTHRRSNSRPFQLPAQPFTPRGHKQSSSQHHRRNSSRNDWRQDDHLAVPQFVPGHRSGGSFGSISSIAAFDQSQSSTRKSLFVPYLSQATIPQLLQDGFLVSGTLRVNRKNRNDAYVSTDVLDADIFICGSKDRNRALDGDLVAIELLDVDEVWEAKREKEEKKRRRDANDDTRLVETSNGELRRRGSLRQRPTHKRNDDVEVEGQSLFLREEEPLSDDSRPLYAGHVVAVLERPAGQLFSGTLGLLRPSSQATKDRQDAERAEKGQPPLQEKPDRPKIVWFKPTDKCVPLMAIPTEQAPEDFVENHQKYADRIFVAAVKRWPITSLHPFGTIIEELGPADDMDVQKLAIIRDNNFGAHKFSEAAQQDVAKAVETIAANERPKVTGIAYKRNGLVQQAFEVTPTSLSVHTIDITPFIREESALDRELHHKSAGAYMIDNEMPLAPQSVFDKLGFAVGRASPAITVKYELKGHEITNTTIELTTVEPTKVVEDVSELSGLEKIASAWEPVSLVIDNFFGEKPFSGQSLLDHTETAVDKINVQLNSTIGQRLLASDYRDATLLRRQGEPTLNRLEALAEAVRAGGFEFDTTNSQKLRESIANIEDVDIKAAIQVALYKALAPPRYVAAGSTDPMAYGHYWHNKPAYTHFDQPFYRYADHAVHRQLHAVIDGEKCSYDDIHRTAALASELSFRLDCARNVQSQSCHLIQSQLLEKNSAAHGYCMYYGVVVQVYESAFDVVIPELSIEKRVHGDQLPLIKAEFHKQKHTLDLEWDPEHDAATYSPAGNNERINASSTATIAKASGIKLEPPSKSESGDNIQKIELFQKVPILVRTDSTGRVVPSITVRTVNPFYA